MKDASAGMERKALPVFPLPPAGVEPVGLGVPVPVPVPLLPVEAGAKVELTTAEVATRLTVAVPSSTWM